MKNTAIVWLRNDLRMTDNPALWEAVKNYDTVIPVYIYDEKLGGNWAIGAASKWWLHRSLEAIRRDIPLVIRSGDSFDEMLKLVEEIKPAAVLWNRRYEPFAIELDSKIKTQLKEQQGIEVISFKANLLFEPWEIKNLSGSNYQVFTRFWQTCVARGVDRDFLPKCDNIKAHGMQGRALSDLKLLPTKPDWAAGFREKWAVGEEAAISAFDRFIENGLADYYEGRNFPSKKAVSELSPHLHFGEISPLYIWHKITPLIEKHGKNATHFLSEIGWREFSYSLIYHNPTLPDANYKAQFDQYEWDFDETLFDKWKKGLTGYPIVDAGMRELWATGYMHNRVRMIVASFLIKDLFIDWRKGEEWFWDTLVDADLASNSASWQWVAGSGADAAPYYRIFNPILQGAKFDPTGAYIKKWIPELKEMPIKYIHTPWDAPSHIKCAYPDRVVDHAIARDIAMQKYKKIQY